MCVARSLVRALFPTPGGDFIKLCDGTGSFSIYGDKFTERIRFFQHTDPFPTQDENFTEKT